MAKGTLMNMLMFGAGAAVGFTAAWKMLKDEYERRVHEDLESVKEERAKREDAKKEMDDSDANPEKEELNRIAKDMGYSNDEDDNYDREEDETDMDKPIVVSPEEVWERDYPTLTLNYYEGDGVITNDRDQIVQNADELIGKDIGSHFGEYEEDCVHVRNDKTRTYYEVLRNYGSFHDGE